MAVVIKKDEKTALVKAAMNNKESLGEFKAKFKEMYPDDWYRIVRTHDKHKKGNKINKGYAMPHPDQYLADLFNKKISQD
ncbi:MAG: hypothetical protein WCP79_13910 [Bacillota bacterium]